MPIFFLSLLVINLNQQISKQIDNKIIQVNLMSNIIQVTALSIRTTFKKPDQSLSIAVQILIKKPKKPVGGCGFLIIQPSSKVCFILSSY
jgi:ABC-type enterochelin transport system permease subunit